jgi:putative phosphoesterase
VVPADAPRAIRIGLISDTHGLLRPQAVQALAGSDYIIHGGDIGDASILEELARIAPVTAVRGNNDRAAWADDVRETEVLSAGGLDIYVIHDLAQLDLDPAAGFRVVISGHSHKPAISTRDGVLYVNPGAAGPRRFTLPVSVGRLSIAGGRADAELLTLQV